MNVFKVFNFLLLLSFLLGNPALGTTYEVGPGKPYGAVGETPLESLQPGDVILIHWRSESYREKWVLAGRGTPEAWITIRGVPGPDGQLPVVDGRDAVTPSALNFWNESRGVLKIGGSNTPPDDTPAYIAVENLEIRGGRPPYGFTGRDGPADYARNCAAVYIEKGEHLVIRNCILHDCGNGIFAGSGASDILVEKCYIHGNGNIDSIYEHNNYTEADGITFQYNRFGPLRQGCLGNNLKDRSAGTVIRYNWIEGGSRQLDLVDSDHAALISLPAYRETHVYGNILIEPEGAGNSQICHYGGDSGITEQYRKGTLYFYNNTLVSTRSGNTTLLRLSTNDETARCRNNILYVSAPGNRLAMLDQAGTLELRSNWTKPDWRQSHDTLTGTITDQGGGISGASPGFASFESQDFRLSESSACRDAGGPLDDFVPAEHYLQSQYVKHLQSAPRPTVEALDLGASERPPPALAGVVLHGLY